MTTTNVTARAEQITPLATAISNSLIAVGSFVWKGLTAPARAKENDVAFELAGKLQSEYPYESREYVAHLILNGVE